MGHREASQHLREAVAESGAWLGPAPLCPRCGCLAGCCLEPLPRLLPVQQLCLVLPLQGGMGLVAGLGRGAERGGMTERRLASQSQTNRWRRPYPIT